MESDVECISQVKKGRSKKKGTEKSAQSSEGDKIKHDMPEELGFFWNEILEGKNSTIAAKNALITELYTIISLLEEKIVHLNEKISVSQSSSRTFSEVTKMASTLENTSASIKVTLQSAQNNNSSNFILIKPTKKQDNQVTKKEISKHINPKNLQVGIQKVFDLKDGGVKIQCSSKEDVEKLRKEAIQKMGNDYETRTENKKSPKIKIIGLEQNYSKEELVKCLKSQNSTISEDSKLEVIIIKKMRTKYMAIVEVDQSVFKAVMESGMVIVDLSVCTIFEHIDLLRCFSCTGYHHTNKNCSSKKMFCLKCGLSGHQAQNCETDTKSFCCPNCFQANEKYKLLFPINHGPFSRECGIFKNKIEIERRKIEYE